MLNSALAPAPMTKTVGLLNTASPNQSDVVAQRAINSLCQVRRFRTHDRNCFSNRL